MNNFYRGEKIVQSTLWKNIDLITKFIAMVIAAIIAILKVFNVNFFLDDQQIIILSGALAVLILAFHTVIAVITSDKIGIDRRERTDPIKSLANVNRRKEE